MNQRNVTALETAVGYGLFGPRLNLTADERDEARTIAIVLASRGVLVPSALSDQEVADLFDVPPGHAENRRKDLEQLAKGETNGN